MGKKYPIEHWTTGTMKNRPAIKNHSCDYCHKPFRSNETVQIKETQVSWFRGEDEVEFFHAQCIKDMEAISDDADREMFGDGNSQKFLGCIVDYFGAGEFGNK